MDGGARALTAADAKRLLEAHGAEPNSTILAIVKTWLARSPGDRFDYYIVYATPSEYWLGLETPKERRHLTVNVASPAIRADEVNKFCSLLKDGDTTVIEALYVDGIYESDAWKELKTWRRELARTKQVYSKYIGQPHRTLIENDDTLPQRRVNYVEVFRWLMEAERLVKGGEPRALWTNSGAADDEELAQLHKRATGTLEEMRARASEMLASLQGKFTTPLSSDATKIQAWLVRLRKSLLPLRKP